MTSTANTGSTPSATSSETSQMPGSNPTATPQHAWIKNYPDGVRWDKTYDIAPLTKLLDDAVSNHADRSATYFYGARLTYSEIGARVAEEAARLQALGVKRGTKVGLFLPNCPAFIIYYYAILKAGGIVVNFNPLYSIDMLTHQITDSDTEIMITLDLKSVFDKIETLLSDGTLQQALIVRFSDMLPSYKSILFRILKSGTVANIHASPASEKLVCTWQAPPPDPSTLRIPTVNPEKDTALLQYTGGTTGIPKGAELTHANLYINVQQVSDWASDLDNDQNRFFAVLPFFHVFAMTSMMNFAIHAAAEIVMMPRFELDDMMKLLTKTRPTVLAGVPTIFTAILSHPKLSSFDMSSLKFCISGGAPLPLDLKKRFERITSCQLVEGYGLSETSPVVSCNPPNGIMKDASIGLPLPQTVISLRSVDDPKIEVPQGDRGEICIKGPQVMAGYWKNPEATKASFIDGYFRTGDVAIMDEDGFFYIVDRIKDLILVSGFNVFPRHIEDALYDHPSVEEAIVIGIPDDYQGETPKAYVTLAAGAQATEDELKEFLKSKISKIEMPSQIEIRKDLPKTMIGKLSRKELREEEEEKRANAA